MLQDLDGLTQDQLRDLAMASSPEAVAALEKSFNLPPRDEQGRFVAAEPEGEPPVAAPAAAVAEEEVTTPPPVEEAPPAEEPPDPNEVVHNGELVYRLVIPGEDGSGDEVFYGHGPDSSNRERDAYRQLAAAKAHANRKIREQNKQIKTQPVVPERPPLTADEEFVLSQKLLTKPSEALRELLERTGQGGLSAEDQATLKEYRDRTRREKTVADSMAVLMAWQKSKPDFYESPRNGKLIGDYVAMYHGGVATPENVEQAYQFSKDLMEAKPAATAKAAPALRPRSSGLSTRTSTAPPAPATYEQKLRAAQKMTSAELRERIERGETLQ